jgi:thioredoxin 1
MLSRRSVLVSALLATTAGAALTPALAITPQPFDDAAFAQAQKAGKPIFVAIHATCARSARRRSRSSPI